MTTPLATPGLQLQPVSVTRHMAAALPKLKAMAEAKGLRLHHLGAGYPHPEVSDPTAYIAHKEAYLRHLTGGGGALRGLLTSLYGYTDTMGPPQARQAFAHVYGNDFGCALDPDLLVPTVGATYGINLMCSAYERSGQDIAYIVDAPTYAGFVSRAALYQRAHLYSVEMDLEGAIPQRLRAQIRKARADGRFVAFYYTVPDGHNPGGISFSQARREQILAVLREEGTYVVEDAPYTYISYTEPDKRPKPFIAMDPQHAVHLFTASKIGLPGPRVGFLYSQVPLDLGGERVLLRDLILGESSGGLLFHNPEALRGFEAYLHDEHFQLRDSLWPVAKGKCEVYCDNRSILLDGLAEGLGAWPEDFSWTEPGAGFFSVFTFKGRPFPTDQGFISRLVAEYGVVVVPMFGFYPADARERDPQAGLDQVRLSFSFNEGRGQERRRLMTEAVAAFCHAIRKETGRA